MDARRLAGDGVTDVRRVAGVKEMDVMVVNVGTVCVGRPVKFPFSIQSNLLLALISL